MSLMCACVGNTEFGRAFRVFEDIRALPQGADAKAFGALMTGCARAGELASAVWLGEEAYGLERPDGNPAETRGRGLPAGQLLDAEQLEQLFLTISQAGLADTMGSQLLEGLRAAGVPVGSKLLSMMAG